MTWLARWCIPDRAFDFHCVSYYDHDFYVHHDYRWDGLRGWLRFERKWWWGRLRGHSGRTAEPTRYTVTGGSNAQTIHIKPLTDALVPQRSRPNRSYGLLRPCVRRAARGRGSLSYYRHPY